MSTPSMLHATRQQYVAPDVVDTITVSGTSATIDITNCGNTTGGRNLKGRWVYFYANGVGVTFLRGSHTLTYLAGQNLATTTSARVYFDAGGSNSLSVIASGAGSIVFAYDSAGGWP